MKRWAIAGRALELSDTDNTIRPTADEVYRVAIERESVWPDSASLKDDLPDLRFSRYPLSVAIVLDAKDGIPFVRATGKAAAQEVALDHDDIARGHVVHDRTWYPLDPATGGEAGEILKGAGVGSGPLSSIRDFLALKKLAATGSVRDETAGLTMSPMLFPPAATGGPAGVDATLYPYQTDGWRWLRFLVREGIGGFLADEMGLGKTLQIISTISDPGTDSLGPVLIIAPGSLLENWRRELRRFAPAVSVLKHHGADRTGRPADLQGFDVVVTSYDNAVRDQSLFLMIEWGAVVLDEAQYIRNPDAQRTRSVKRLRRKVGIAVTGTPVENRLLDLWSIMDFVLPDYLGSAADFQKHFDDDQDGAAALEPFVSPVLLRRLVADVAKDLPTRIDIPQAIELEADEARSYDAVRQRILAEYGKAGTLVSLTLLRQFCAHPGLLDEQAADPMSFSKFRRLDEILAEIFSRREKAIVFTSYNRMSDMIAGHFGRAYGAFTGQIDGRLAIDERQDLIDRFSAVDGPAVLILNPRAGGAGLNITAANHVVHYNLEWNPALEDQASARAYRRGQTKPVTVHRLYIADTVEDVVNARLDRKRSISASAVIGVEGAEDDFADVVAALERSPLSEGKR